VPRTRRGAVRRSALRRTNRSGRADPNGSFSEERALDRCELWFETGKRLAEKTTPFEQPHRIRRDAARPEIDNLHRNVSADPIQSADSLLDDRRFPWQVEQHQPLAEFEVTPFAAGFGRDEQARAIGFAEARHLGVPTHRGELLVEHAGGELRPMAEHRAQHLQRLAMRDEDERLLAGGTPARRPLQQPLDARIVRVH
jgi:hypothetical protein